MRPFFSLRYKFLLIIIGLTLGSLAFITTLYTTQNFLDYRQLTDLILKISERSNAIQNSIENNDVTLSTEQLEELKSNPNIVDAEIFGYINNTLISYSGHYKKPPSIVSQALGS